jgi:3-hydroxyacyl-CoA dehydrogenase/enoyl-CoA hydratase/3-hydroxybutyryl-CoA epimerase
LSPTYFREEHHPDGVLAVTLDFPGIRINKLSDAVWIELGELVSGWQSNAAIRAVVLQSAKPGIFLAGADIEELTGIGSHATAVAMSERAQVIFNRLENCGKPVVAAVNGAALGGGLELVLACHGAVAADDRKVKLGLPETKLGLLPAAGGTQRLPRMVGVDRALEMILGGESLTAHEALAAGLVNRVVPLEDLLTAARTMALELAASKNVTKRWMPGERRNLEPMLAGLAPRDDKRFLAWSKSARAVVEGTPLSFDEGLLRERELFADLLVSPEAKELIDRFLNKS